MARILRGKAVVGGFVGAALAFFPQRQGPEESVRQHVAHAGAKAGVERLIEESQRFADRGLQLGAGDTLSAALAALLASGTELHTAVGESLAFLDQALDAGFRPGMGNVVPDRFFWALPPDEEGDEGADGSTPDTPSGSRQVH